MADEPKVEPTGEPMQLESAPEGATEPTVQPESQVDIDGLVATLEKIGVRNPQHLEGIYNTAQAHGPTAQELGQARQEIARLQQEVATMKQTPQRPADPYANPYDQSQGTPIDLEQSVERAAERVIHRTILEPQAKMSEAYWRDVETVQSSEYYPMVQEDFQVHIQKPHVQRALATGQTTQTQELYKIVGAKFKDIAQNLKSAASSLKGQTPAQTQPPHIETGQIPPEQQARGEQARQQELDKISKEAKGTDDDLDAMLKALLPDDDPILG